MFIYLGCDTPFAQFIICNSPVLSSCNAIIREIGLNYFDLFNSRIIGGTFCDHKPPNAKLAQLNMYVIIYSANSII